MTALEVILSTAMVGAGGIAIGKLWGSYGRQTETQCGKIREVCKTLWQTMFDNVDTRLLSIEHRLERIEEKVDRING